MLIFLDIDGVMVPAKPWKAPELLQDGFPAFSSTATMVLQQLLADGAGIMLTSSHKSNYSIPEWRTIFRNRGIVTGKLGLLDDNISHLNRRQEIENWLKLNLNNENFVIIDDDTSLNDLPPHLKTKLLLTSSHVGLTENHLDQVRMLASGELKSI